MKKYLIVSGDSFTKGHTLGEKGSWAYHTAKKMNLELINLSENGMGNKWISSNIISFLYRHESILNECIVMVGWTDFMRELLFYKLMVDDKKYYTDIFTIVPYDLHPDMNHNPNLPIYGDFVNPNKNILNRIVGNEIVCLYETYFSILHLKTILEKNNVPYLFFDAVSNNKLYKSSNYNYILSNDNKEIIVDFNTSVPFLNDIIDLTFINKIFNKNYIKFEEKTIFQWISQNGYEKYEEGNPGHTNELGADYISNIIIKEYDNLYN